MSKKSSWQDITTIEQVYQAKGLDPKKQPNEDSFEGFLWPFTLASYRLALIVSAINPGFIPDWNNTNQRKWWGWFWMNDPGFRLCVSFCDFTGTHSACGSRLCCETNEQFRHIVKYFLPYLEAFYRGQALAS